MFNLQLTSPSLSYTHIKSDKKKKGLLLPQHNLNVHFLFFFFFPSLKFITSVAEKMATNKSAEKKTRVKNYFSINF